MSSPGASSRASAKRRRAAALQKLEKEHEDEKRMDENGNDKH
jgi:hypothetical protein